MQRIITQHNPDILLLSGFDYDTEQRALWAFNLGLGKHRYDHMFARRPNSGMATGLDMNGDGEIATPKDAQGFGAFSGQKGLALLSRFPVAEGGVLDFTDLLWVDLPDPSLPQHDDGSAFPTHDTLQQQRLSSVAHWVIPLSLDNGTVLRLLAYQAGPPVFDGPEDQNGKRNHDETTLWLRLLDGQLPARINPPFVLLGGANLDPVDGAGRHGAVQGLLDHPALQDPRPKSEGARLAANPHHAGNPALDTADWQEPQPGNLRVDYVLPSAELTVSGAGVFWPAPDHSDSALARRASRHRMVWVDIELP